MRSGGPVAMLVMLLCLAACGGAEPGRSVPADAPSTLVDADGREVSLALPVDRVVSLVPSATVTLDVIGARDVLVARTDYDTAAWAASLPSVGGGIEPSVEAILAARPDLVIRFGGPQDVRTPARLRDLGIPSIAIRPDRVADVLDVIRLMGRITGRTREADSLAARLDSELDSVRARAADAPQVRVAYVLGGDPPWVAGPDTYIDELIRLAGGVNVFSDLASLYTAVSPEEFVARDIDLVLLAEGGTFDRTLARDAAVEEVDGEVERPGPSVAESARQIAAVLRAVRR